jgi:cell division protein FtsB
MFWGLLMMAGATFAACVLVPILVEYEQLTQQLIDTQRQTAALEAELQQTEKTIEAIRTDPAAAEQSAKIGLNYRRSGERQITVLSEREIEVLGNEAAPAPEGPPPEPIPTPRLYHGLAALPWRSLFCEPTSRRVLLITSGGMILLAFALYDGRRRSAR